MLFRFKKKGKDKQPPSQPEMSLEEAKALWKEKDPQLHKALEEYQEHSTRFHEMFGRLLANFPQGKDK